MAGARKRPRNSGAAFVHDAGGYSASAVLLPERFDAVGNRVSLTDAVGNVTTWVYDALDRVTTETDPLGNSATYAYDGVGRKVSETDRLGRRRDFGFDAAGRLETETWYAVGGALTQTQTFTYDAADRMLTAQDPDGAYTLAYDAAGRVTSVREPFALVLTMGYDAVGNRTSVQDSQGGVTTVSFDALNRQQSEQVGGSGVSAMRFDRGYSARGELTSVTRYSDLSGTTTVALSQHDYDAAGRQTHLKHTSGAGVTLAEYTYTYDAADRLTEKVEGGTSTTYAYDSADQLTVDGTSGFSYDGTGNRTNSGYATGTGNRISTDGVWTYTHDANGNVTKRSKGASSDTWVYTYDHRNQMLTASFSATDGGAATKRVTYSYDAFGVQITRQSWEGSTTTTTHYGRDGWDPAKPAAIGNEQFDAWVALDATNALLERYAFGPAFHEVVAIQDSGGVVDWALTDYQKSVRVVIDNSGVVQSSVSYSAYGAITTGSLSIQIGYTGYTWNPVTGLWETPGRVYNAETGQFLQADFLGFAAGDPNLFRYVGNSPTNATDPSGLVELPAWYQNLAAQGGGKIDERAWRSQFGKGTEAMRHFYQLTDYSWYLASDDEKPGLDANPQITQRAVENILDAPDGRYGDLKAALRYAEGAYKAQPNSATGGAATKPPAGVGSVTPNPSSSSQRSGPGGTLTQGAGSWTFSEAELKDYKRRNLLVSLAFRTEPYMPAPNPASALTELERGSMRNPSGKTAIEQYSPEVAEVMKKEEPKAFARMGEIGQRLNKVVEGKVNGNRRFFLAPVESNFTPFSAPIISETELKQLEAEVKAIEAKFSRIWIATWNRQRGLRDPESMDYFERMVYEAEKEIDARNERVQIVGPALVLTGEIILVGLQAPRQGTAFGGLGKTVCQESRVIVARAATKVGGKVAPGVGGKVAPGRVGTPAELEVIVDRMMVSGKAPRGVGELPLTAEDIDLLRRAYRNDPTSTLQIITDPKKIASKRANALFSVTDTGMGRITLKENPSWYEFIHEFMHYKHWMAGKTQYARLTQGQKELHVFEKLLERHPTTGSSYWNRLTKEERLHAIGAIRDHWKQFPREFKVEDTIRMRDLLRQAEQRLGDPVR